MKEKIVISVRVTEHRVHVEDAREEVCSGNGSRRLPFGSYHTRGFWCVKLLICLVDQWQLRKLPKQPITFSHLKKCM